MRTTTTAGNSPCGAAPVRLLSTRVRAPSIVCSRRGEYSRRCVCSPSPSSRGQCCPLVNLLLEPTRRLSAITHRHMQAVQGRTWREHCSGSRATIAISADKYQFLVKIIVTGTYWEAKTCSLFIVFRFIIWKYKSQILVNKMVFKIRQSLVQTHAHASRLCPARTRRGNSRGGRRWH
jgi:hypothetical protein